MKFEIYRDKAGEWRWRMVCRNGRVVADSGEGYTRRRDARRAAEMVIGGARWAVVVERECDR